MKQYSITAKLWIKIEAKSQEEAQAIAKTIIDESLYDYVAVNQKVPADVRMSMSKAKIIWVKEEDKKHE